MGTNYYIYDNCCDKCGRADEVYHIGKSSMGWCFSLHIDWAEGINNLGDIKELWQNKTIKDEYGSIISEDEMIDIITNRCRPDDTETPYGYKSWDEFHSMNHSEPGPNNMFRHKVDGSHCVGHGDGTYDYIAGEFS